MLNNFISIAYWKRLISGVKLSVVVPQDIRISLCNSASTGTPNPPDTVFGHGCINMMSAKNVVTHYKDYGMSQLNLGKEPAPPESPLHIEKHRDKLEAPPCNSKWVLNRLGHNPNSKAS